MFAPLSEPSGALGKEHPDDQRDAETSCERIPNEEAGARPNKRDIPCENPFAVDRPSPLASWVGSVDHLDANGRGELAEGELEYPATLTSTRMPQRLNILEVIELEL